jgi:hypothetical protein
MAKVDVNPDALASKTFFVTLVGALLYITVVFTFVIHGNREDEKAMELEANTAQGH